MIVITVIVRVGRRVPNSWFKRGAQKAAGFISFQSNVWEIIKQSFSLAKRKATESGKLKFVIQREREREDMNYSIEWLKVIIQGTEEQEIEEEEEALKMYAPLNQVLKKDIPKNDISMSKRIKSKYLTEEQINKAYKEGMGSIDDNNLSNKLLEMAIITHIERIKDYDNRDEAFF